VLQTVEIVCQPEQQSLATLRKETAAGRTTREFSLGGREDGFDQGPVAVEAAWKVVAHLGTDAVDAPGFLAAFGGNEHVAHAPSRVHNRKRKTKARSLSS
jgi:hypothetical protein